MQLRVRRKDDGAIWFDLTSDDRMNHWPPDPRAWAGGPRIYTGDGTVPYQGGRCPFIPTEEAVCVADVDYGYWELKDRGLEGVVGLHGMLPTMNFVQKLIVCQFSGTVHDGVWGRRAPDLLGDWKPPIRRLREKTT